MNQALEQLAARPPQVRVGQATAIEQSRAVAEVQAAIVVAQSCPRDMVRAWAEMRAACGRIALANRAFYAVPNRGSGPSVHLARELARIWGNLDYGVKELRRDDDAHESEVLAYAWDQQTNVRSTRSLIVPHAKMAGGQRRQLVDLSDIYLNNQNVGARAVRETLFTVMPADFVAEAQDLCRVTIEKGDGQPLDKRIAAMVEAFATLGVNVARMEARLDKKRGQWTPVDIADLSVVYGSIKRGELKTDDEFPQQGITAAEVAGPKAAKTSSAAPRPVGVGQDQIQAMEQLFAQVECTDLADQLARIGEFIDRPVDSWSELSRREADQVIAKLRGWALQDEPPADGA